MVRSNNTIGAERDFLREFWNGYHLVDEEVDLSTRGRMALKKTMNAKETVD